jgi:hypothetical protein
MTRVPCPSCPWRKSTPPGGFPGGCLDTRRLLNMASGDFGPAMQCHSTPDGEHAQVCVGFALVVGFDSMGLRLAALQGLYDPDTVAADEDLHTLASVLRTHGEAP